MRVDSYIILLVWVSLSFPPTLGTTLWRPTIHHHACTIVSPGHIAHRGNYQSYSLEVHQTAEPSLLTLRHRQRRSQDLRIPMQEHGGLTWSHGLYLPTIEERRSSLPHAVIHATRLDPDDMSDLDPASLTPPDNVFAAAQLDMVAPDRVDIPPFAADPDGVCLICFITRTRITVWILTCLMVTSIPVPVTLILNRHPLAASMILTVVSYTFII